MIEQRHINAVTHARWLLSNSSVFAESFPECLDIEYSIVSAHLFKLNDQSRSTLFCLFKVLITVWIWNASSFLHDTGLELMDLLWGLCKQWSEVSFQVHEELFDGIKPRGILSIHQDTGTHTLNRFRHWWMSMDSCIVHQHDDVFVLGRVVSSKLLQIIIIAITTKRRIIKFSTRIPLGIIIQQLITQAKLL